MEAKDYDALKERIQESLKRKEEAKLSELKNVKESLPKIESLKEAISSLTEKYLKPAFAEAGESIVILYNDKSSQTKNNEDFVELLFYPKGQNKEIRGVNTAALRFVFDPKEAKIHVWQRASLFPRPLKEEESIVINEDSEKALSNKAIEFATLVATNQ